MNDNLRLFRCLPFSSPAARLKGLSVIIMLCAGERTCRRGCGCMRACACARRAGANVCVRARMCACVCSGTHVHACAFGCGRVLARVCALGRARLRQPVLDPQLKAQRRPERPQKRWMDDIYNYVCHAIPNHTTPGITEQDHNNDHSENRSDDIFDGNHDLDAHNDIHNYTAPRRQPRQAPQTPQRNQQLVEFVCHFLCTFGASGAEAVSYLFLYLFFGLFTLGIFVCFLHFWCIRHRIHDFSNCGSFRCRIRHVLQFWVHQASG
jgi:hypothetical protein